MSKRTTWLAILVTAAALCLGSQQALALTETTVDMAGSGVFPANSYYQNYLLLSLRYGVGVSVFSDGTASGDFDLTVVTTQAGQPRNITIEGKAANGSVPKAGQVIFSGLSTVDMGDGSPPYTAVPFSVKVDGNKQTLQLTMGNTTLNIATGTKGKITIK
jgi:hypothetical protein